MNELGFAIVGEVVILLIVLAIVCLVLREFVRIVLKVIAVVAIVTAVALWLGLLDETLVLDILARVGDWVMSGGRSAADWVTMAAIAG